MAVIIAIPNRELPKIEELVLPLRTSSDQSPKSSGLEFPRADQPTLRSETADTTRLAIG